MNESKQSLNEQSLSMLKQQSNRIKVQYREIQLKQQQIVFLKDTILALQQEKDAILLHNAQLKGKLKTMASEISEYNSTVVQKIYQENQQLHGQIAELMEKCQESNLERSSLQKQIRILQEDMQNENKDKSENGILIQKMKQINAKNQKKTELLQKQNRQLVKKNINLQRQLEQSSNQVTYCSQQIDILTQKHHDSVKLGEKKLKQAQDKMVSKEEFVKNQRDLKEAQMIMGQMKKELEKMQKDKEKNKFQMLNYKEKLLSIEVKAQTKNIQLKSDLVNLIESLKIKKKIVQFESQEEENFALLFTNYMQVLEDNQKLQRSVELAEKKSKKLDGQLKHLQQTLKLTTMELQDLRQRRQDQKQALQSQYQSKLMQISIRLRKQQMALASLRSKQSAFEQLQEQYDHQVQERQNERQSLNHTIEQLKKENTKISLQLSEALKLCEENIYNQECISNYKYVMQDIVAVVHYLYQLYLQFRKKNKVIMYPFLNYYYQRFKEEEVAKKQMKGAATRKLRIASWMIIAILRMSKTKGTGRGLERHAKYAVQNRKKVDNMGKHIQTLSQNILDGKNIKQILQQTRPVYHWDMNSFYPLKIQFSASKVEGSYKSSK